MNNADNKMISFIGAGKVGLALGRYFKQKGLPIGGYYSRTHANALHAANTTGAKAYTSIKELMSNSTMVWITATDDALPQLAAEIAQLPIPQHIEAFVHTSGVHAANVLQPIYDKGFAAFCAHPLMAFTDAKEGAEQLKSAYFSVETLTTEHLTEGEKGENCLMRLLKQTGNNTMQIDSNKKELYHCAASVLSNYMVTLLNMAYEMFAETGMDKSEIKKATAPLLASTLKNIEQHETMSDALTGAIKRGDATTVAKHLAALEQYMPENKAVYSELGKATMAMLQDYKLKDILK